MDDPQRWVRLKRVFARASELDGPERRAFLDRELGEDRELRAEIEDLLAADERSPRFLEAGVEAAHVGGEDRWTGRRLGPYEVVGELGRGGVGIVLLGRRADGRYDRDVALKVVPAALVQGHVEARFRAEVRILAELDHPNIARLLDAGETPEGLTYLVMEYVDGPPIDVFADEAALDVSARLALFRAVLEGVDHAHGRGIVHRDLKPSNILVTSTGVPKLVDFGIAKLLGATGPGRETVVVTRTSQRMLTPEYASPEQVRGQPVDARTDVYSLGVVLYRLLTGRPPYSLDSTTPRGAERVICESHPSRPSDAVTRTVPEDPDATRPAPDPDVLARRRSSTRDRLQRLLRGDLDTIVLKAMEKEPARRYATAGAFADDIDRYLGGRPIRGRASGPLYRARRYLRRRRLPLAAGIAAVLAGVGVTWQARVADAERRMAEASSAELTQLVGAVLGTLNTDLAGEDQGPTATRARAVEAAVASLDSLAARMDGPPGVDLLRALAAAYQEVAVLQGHPLSSNVGRIDDAEASFRTSITLWSELLRRQPDDVDARLELAETRVLLADIHRSRGANDRAGAVLAEAEAAVDSVAEAAPDRPGLLSTRAMVYERQATQAESLGDFATATAYVGRLTDLAVRVAEAMPDGPARWGALEEVVLALQAESYMHSKAARTMEAIALQERAVALADSLAGLPGPTQRMRGIRAAAWQQLGWRLNDADRPDEAEAAFTRALEHIRRIRDDDPRNVTATASVGQYHEGRGQARIRGERWAAAVDDHTRAIEILTPLLSTLPSVGFIVSQAHRQRGEAYTRLGRVPEAEADYARAIAMSGELFRSDTTFAPSRKVLALAHLSHALHFRLRAAASGEEALCTEAVVAASAGRVHWTVLRDRGQVAPGEEAIWVDFESMMPPGVCVDA